MRITRAAGVALVLLAGFAAPFSAAAGGEEEGRGGGGLRPQSRGAPPQTPEPAAAPAPVDPSEWRSEDHIVQVEVKMDPSDWDELRLQDRRIDQQSPGWSCQPFESPFEWYKAESITIDGKVYEQGRVRKKGSGGSLSTNKPSLKLRLDKYIDQDHFGTTRLTLNNSNQDKSMLNTCLAYKIFRDAGIPAPLCNWASVTVNGEDMGTYINVEDMKTDFFERAFNKQGNLYEGASSDFAPELTGTFEKKTKNDGLGYIYKVKDAIDAGDIERLEELIDIDKFITFWAVDGLIGNWDGYSGNTNNYYFHESDSGLVFIPWGPDSTFGHPKRNAIYLKSALSRALFPKYLKKYRAEMSRLLRDVWNESSLLEWVFEYSELVGEHSGEVRVFYFIYNRRRYLNVRMRRDNFQNIFDNHTIQEGNCPNWIQP